MKTPCILLIILAFLFNTIGPMPLARGEDFHLPAPGSMVQLSPSFNPPILKGLKVHPDNPFKFEFILDRGDGNNRYPEQGEGSQGVLRFFGVTPQDDKLVKQEAARLIKYFLASLTIPEQDLWVNLSPYEKNRIVPESFGKTEMGRDLLAEDYMLKQITASLIYPDGETGKKFWKRIYAEAAKKFGTTNIPVNTFNKVWIVPEKAVVYENAKAGTAYVVEARLKVMLEEDYLSLTKHNLRGRPSVGPLNGRTQGSPLRNNIDVFASVGANIIREIVIPALTREVNEGANFAQLRQVYNSLILATWYKKKIKDSILAQVYEDKNKVRGVNYDKSVIFGNKVLYDSSASPQNDTELIYRRYLQAFKKGAYNIIKEEQDPLTQEIVPHKYFSGGLTMNGRAMDAAMRVVTNPEFLSRAGRAMMSSWVVNAVFNVFRATNTGPASSNNRLDGENKRKRIISEHDQRILKYARNVPGFMKLIWNSKKRPLSVIHAIIDNLCENSDFDALTVKEKNDQNSPLEQAIEFVNQMMSLGFSFDDTVSIFKGLDISLYLYKYIINDMILYLENEKIRGFILNTKRSSLQNVRDILRNISRKAEDRSDSEYLEAIAQLSVLLKHQHDDFILRLIDIWDFFGRREFIKDLINHKITMLQGKGVQDQDIVLFLKTEFRTLVNINSFHPSLADLWHFFENDHSISEINQLTGLDETGPQIFHRLIVNLSDDDLQTFLRNSLPANQRAKFNESIVLLSAALPLKKEQGEGRDKSEENAIAMKIFNQYPFNDNKRAAALGVLVSNKDYDTVERILKGFYIHDSSKLKPIDNILRKLPVQLIAGIFKVNLRFAQYLIRNGGFEKLLDPAYKTKIDAMTSLLNKERTSHHSVMDIEQDQEDSLIGYLLQLNDLTHAENVFNGYFYNTPDFYHLDIGSMIELIERLSSMDQFVAIMERARENPGTSIEWLFSDLKENLTQTKDPNADFLIKRIPWLLSNVLASGDKIYLFLNMLPKDAPKKRVTEFLKGVESAKSFSILADVSEKYQANINDVLAFKIASLTPRQREEYLVNSIVNFSKLNFPDSLFFQLLKQFDQLPQQSRRRIYFKVLFSIPNNQVLDRYINGKLSIDDISIDISVRDFLREYPIYLKEEDGKFYQLWNKLMQSDPRKITQLKALYVERVYKRAPVAQYQAEFQALEDQIALARKGVPHIFFEFLLRLDLDANTLNEFRSLTNIIESHGNLSGVLQNRLYQAVSSYSIISDPRRGEILLAVLKASIRLNGGQLNSKNIVQILSTVTRLLNIAVQILSNNLRSLQSNKSAEVDALKVVGENLIKLLLNEDFNGDVERISPAHLDSIEYGLTKIQLNLLLSAFQQKLKRNLITEAQKLALINYFKGVQGQWRDHENRSLAYALSYFLGRDRVSEELARVMFDSLMARAENRFDAYKFKSPDYIIFLSGVIASFLETEATQEDKEVLDGIHGNNLYEKLAGDHSTEGLDRIWRKVKNIKDILESYLSLELDNGVKVVLTHDFKDLVNSGNWRGSTACQNVFFPSGDTNFTLAGYIADGTVLMATFLDSKGRVIPPRRMVKLLLTKVNGKIEPVIFVEEYIQHGDGPDVKQLYRLIDELSRRTGLKVVTPMEHDFASVLIGTRGEKVQRTFLDPWEYHYKPYSDHLRAGQEEHSFNTKEPPIVEDLDIKISKTHPLEEMSLDENIENKTDIIWALNLMKSEESSIALGELAIELSHGDSKSDRNDFDRIIEELLTRGHRGIEIIENIIRSNKTKEELRQELAWELKKRGHDVSLMGLAQDKEINPEMRMFLAQYLDEIGQIELYKELVDQGVVGAVEKLMDLALKRNDIEILSNLKNKLNVEIKPSLLSIEIARCFLNLSDESENSEAAKYLFHVVENKNTPQNLSIKAASYLSDDKFVEYHQRIVDKLTELVSFYNVNKSDERMERERGFRVETTLEPLSSLKHLTGPKFLITGLKPQPDTFGVLVLERFRSELILGVPRQTPVLGQRGKILSLLERLKSGDHAMIHRKAVSDKAQLNNGGIDFNPEKMNLKISGSNGIKFYIDPAQLAQLKNSLGFVPLIISIQPLTNLRQFLGITTN